MYTLCKVLIVLWTIFCILGLIGGLINISEIQPLTEAEETGVAIGTAIGVGFWLTLWFIPTVVLGVIGILVKPRDNNIQAYEQSTLCPECGKYYTGVPAYCPNCGKKT